MTSAPNRNRSRRLRFLAALAGCAVVATLLTAPTIGAVQAQTSPGAQPAPEFTASKEISRTHLIDGKDQLVEKKTFQVSVSNTTNLRGHQMIDVSWSGAHPTGGILLDPNSGTSIQEEYPMVLLQCAGIDSDTAPAAQRLTPETCWTATPNERFQNTGVGDAFPPYRVDRYADASDRRAIVGEPQPRKGECGGQSTTERWVHFRTLAGADYPNGPILGCGGMAPEAVAVGDTLAHPSNTTYATTELDGTGTATFDVWTREQNTSLGCDDKTPCALVAVPILGISCDTEAASLPSADRPAAGEEAAIASATCGATGQFEPGQRTFIGRSFDLSVSGALWWSASNWRNRVTIPLQFAPPSNVCDIIDGSTHGVELYGSELVAQATAQWSPHFCLDPKLFKLRHVQTPEIQARGSLADGSVQGVLSSSVPDGGFATPTVNAPVAMTGFAVSFIIDDANKQQLQRLKLTPRLLAKLLTASYPAVLTVKSQVSALANNPLDITSDPEFQALNPDAPKNIGNSVSASALIALSSDSDVIQALTSYIDSDPEARSFLDGRADPWGMTVNPAYKGIDLPATGWPLLDTFVPQFTSTANACLFHNPVPFSPLVAAPMARLFQISLALQFAIANSTTNCHQPVEGDFTQIQLKPIGRQYPGFRFMLGITSLGDAQRYGLDTAELQTSSTSASEERFTDASGRTFVAPNEDSLRAAAATLQPDEATRTWKFGSTTAKDAPKAADAYPASMLVYAQVPTKGLEAEEAKEFATFLRFAATDGQTPGYGNGQLPPGFLPLTAANGLGALADYTLRAAAAVEAQDGSIPALVPVDHGAKPTASDPPAGFSGSAPTDQFSDDFSVSDPFGTLFGDLTAGATPDAEPEPKDEGAEKEPAESPKVATVAYLSDVVGRLLRIAVVVAVVAGGAALVISAASRRRSRRAAVGGGAS